MTDEPDETSALVARREQIVSEVLAEYDQDYRLALSELAHRLAVAEERLEPYKYDGVAAIYVGATT